MTARPKRQRFPMRLTLLGRLMAAPLVVKKERAYVDVTERDVHVLFAPAFDERFPLSQIEEAVPAVWPIWAGIGPRTNFRGAVGIVGSYRNTVELRFKEAQEVRVVAMPVKCERLYISMEDPEAFIAALTARLEQKPRALVTV
jgi:hypothetical protein